MEEKLKTLFDFQRYEQNARLQTVIDSVKARYSTRELSLEDMEWVAAAGVPETQDAMAFRRGKQNDR